MANFIFPEAARDVLDADINLAASTFTIVPVEQEPSKSVTRFDELSGVVQYAGTTTFASLQLQDIDSDSNNRIVEYGGPPAVGVQMVYDPLVWPALDTVSGNPITGFVILNTSSTFPSSAVRPIFYLEALNTGTGVPESFVPDGVTDLVIDLTTYPVYQSPYADNVFDSFRLEFLDRLVTITGTMSIVLLEGKPARTLTDWQGLLASGLVVNDTGGSPIVRELTDIQGSSNNRFFVTGEIAKTRFNDVFYAALATQTNNPITYYTIVNGNVPLQNSDKLTVFGQLAVNGVVTGFTPNGTDPLKLQLSVGTGIVI